MAGDLLQVREHRPYPIPERPWIIAQTWNRVLFAHWPVPSGQMASHIPQQLTLDKYEGCAWIGVLAFNITGFRLRGLPPLPLLSSFPEINVRTYVLNNGKPGVYFFSLDAASRLAVESSRLAFHLPYLKARIQASTDPNGITTYRAERTDTRASSGVFQAVYRPITAPKVPQPGTFEYWAAERYCLYIIRGTSLYRGEIHHRPWLLQLAEADIAANTLSPKSFLPILTENKPILHYAQKQPTLIWPLELSKSHT